LRAYDIIHEITGFVKGFFDDVDENYVLLRRQARLDRKSLTGIEVAGIMGREGTPMGTARQPEPVKLIASLLTGNLALLDGVKEALIRAFGQIDFESELLPFDHTDYYAPEFGPGLQRQIVTFENLVDPGDLPAIKWQTNDLEWSLAVDGHRPVNVDPGYVSLGKMVLASTKNHAHRLYLGQGIIP
jgi:hypothetical protein